MKLAIANLAFCILLMFVTDANSFKCYVCDDGKCEKPEEKECVVPAPAAAADAAATTAAPAARLIERDDAPAATTAAAGAAADVTWFCFTLTGKKGGEDKTYKGCAPAENCAHMADKVDDVKEGCKTCNTELCNKETSFGFQVKPSMFFVGFIAIACLIVSTH